MKKNTLILVAVSFLVALAAYWYFFMNAGNQAPLTAVPEPSSTQMQFDSLSSQLPVSFDTSIFSDPRFIALVDITQPIQQEPAGRADPLAPISGTTATK
ncbi:hypothetical protein KGM48_01960 [Patescibacteria group bacterium]|nr:hypothetical protein [Patescibacteria group bacterium]